jgi:hypothetical protein
MSGFVRVLALTLVTVGIVKFGIEVPPGLIDTVPVGETFIRVALSGEGVPVHP